MTHVMTHRMLFCYGPLCDVRLCSEIQTPTGSNHTPYPYPTSVIPQPTLLGARESDETTLPLLNRVILRSLSGTGPEKEE